MYDEDLLVTNDMSMISMYNTTTMDSTDMSTMSSPMSMTDDLLSPSAGQSQISYLYIITLLMK